jgi:hypothetical protein
LNIYLKNFDFSVGFTVLEVAPPIFKSQPQNGVEALNKKLKYRYLKNCNSGGTLVGLMKDLYLTAKICNEG